MAWRKLGMLFCPDGEFDWMRSHASNPVPLHLEDDLYRIYFSCRDSLSRSSVGFVDIDFGRSFERVRLSETPVLSPGKLGLYDDSGVSVGCILRKQNQYYLYYLGWNLSVTVPWRNSIGLAVGEGSDPVFHKVSRAPLLDRSEVDPYSISYPFVLHDEGIYRMWYGSNLSWGPEQKDMAHVIKYAESTDGLHWKREGRIAIAHKESSEYAVSKPSVLKEHGLYHMWFAHRGESYQIGYAQSENGLEWRRMDERAGIACSATGWDSEMLCYPYVFFRGSEKFMLYNGNEYGKSGFGIAQWEV